MNTTAAWLERPENGTTAGGTTFGVPFPREGAPRPGALGRLRVTAPDGEPVPAQAWPTATWPDGGVKWAGVAIGAQERVHERYTIALAPAGPSDGAAVASPVAVTETDDEIAVDTGVVRVDVPRSGEAFLRRVERGGVVIAENGRLVSTTVDRILEDDDEGPVTRTRFASRVTGAVVESAGPVRAVVRVEGVHAAASPGAHREWLPFRIRLYLAHGARSVRLVHTLVWDGDEHADVLSSLGVRFDVPLRDALHDRHVRISGADDGFHVEAVKGVTGLRRDPGAAVRSAQVDGRPTPPLDEWAQTVSRRMHLVPSWPDRSLSQLTSDGFLLRKRTGRGMPWIRVTTGTRSSGFAYLGGVSGGLGVGMRDFWRSYPVGIDIRRADTDAGELTHWLHAPDAPPMDLRFYHDGLGQDGYADQLEALEITYEDYEPGFGTPYGVARTHELTLFAYEATPSVDALADDARQASLPPALQVDTTAVHEAGLFGDWAPVDRSTPARAALQDRLDFLSDFYMGQVEERRWYGFWDHGDVMHSYDADRHVWRYDVGGYAWDNSELSPDLWLWYAYLRSGRADLFRFAERMTRHTGEVDVYHLGRWAGLGSRHNVLHWGCSAKQHRISNPAYRRFLHYLTADERIGDLLDELVDSDRTFLSLDPTRKVRTDVYEPDRNALAVGLGTDWGALAATWLTAWERTGDEHARDRLIGTMRDIGDLAKGFLTGEALYDLDTGRFDTSRVRVQVSHLSAVFGLVEIASELISLVDEPGFRDAWLQYCRLYQADAEEQRAEAGEALTGTSLRQAHSRLTAYAAARTGDAALARRAWREFAAGGELLGNETAFVPRRVEPPLVLNAVTEAPSVSTNDAAQFGLAAIQLLALVGDAIPGE